MPHAQSSAADEVAALTALLAAVDHVGRARALWTATVPGLGAGREPPPGLGGRAHVDAGADHAVPGAASPRADECVCETLLCPARCGGDAGPDAELRWSAMLPVSGPAWVAYARSRAQTALARVAPAGPGAPETHLDGTGARTGAVPGLGAVRTNIVREVDFVQRYADEQAVVLPASCAPGGAAEGGTSAPVAPRAPDTSNTSSLCAQVEQVLAVAMRPRHVLLHMSTVPAPAPRRTKKGAPGPTKKGAAKPPRLGATYAVLSSTGSATPVLASLAASLGTPLARRQVWLKLYTGKENVLLAQFREAEAELEPDSDSSRSGSDSGLDAGPGTHLDSAPGPPHDSDEQDLAFKRCSLYTLLHTLAETRDAAASPVPIEVEVVLTRLQMPACTPSASHQTPMKLEQLYSLPETQRYEYRLRRLMVLASQLGIKLVSPQTNLDQLKQAVADQVGGSATDVVLPSERAKGVAGEAVLPTPPCPCRWLRQAHAKERPDHRSKGPKRTTDACVGPDSGLGDAHVNLDLSALVALISDVSHTPFREEWIKAVIATGTDASPTGEEEVVPDAIAQAFRSVVPWKVARQEQAKAQAQAADSLVQARADPLAPVPRPPSPDGPATHTRRRKSGSKATARRKPAQQGTQAGMTQGRALAVQLTREVRLHMRGGGGFLPYLASLGTGKVYLYATRAALDKLHQITRLVAGPGERRRADLVLGASHGEFWAGSRYERDARVRSKLVVPVQVWTEPEAAPGAGRGPTLSVGDDAFLACAQRAVLDGLQLQEAAVPDSHANVRARVGAPTQMAHTLGTLHVGLAAAPPPAPPASRIVTLTTGLASVRWLVRQVSDGLGPVASAALLAPHQHPRILVTYPRSLAEHMRAGSDDESLPERDAQTGRLVAGAAKHQDVPAGPL